MTKNHQYFSFPGGIVSLVKVKGPHPREDGDGRKRTLSRYLATLQPSDIFP